MRYLLLLLLLLLLSSCGKKVDSPSSDRGVYHWKTTYAPNAWEKNWLRDHHVNKLYVKLFEVDAGEKHGFPGWSMVPVATTRFAEPLPADMEVVPVIYITLDAINALNPYDDYRYASMLVDRVFSMMDENWDGKVSELQIDCDWTQSTRFWFFNFAQSLDYILYQRGVILSGTVRLHQLSDEDIPFDRCMLMCYNTGRLQDASTHNSILDFNDAAPFLRNAPETLENYDIAWPAYGWGLAFTQDGKFLKITKPEANENVRIEWGEPSQVAKVRQALPEMNSPAVVLFHLDSANLSHYSYEEIENLFAR